MKKRTEVDQKYKWDLSFLFSSDEEWEKAFEDYQNDMSMLTSFDGKLTNEKNILACFKSLEKMSLKLEDLYLYANCNHDLNVANPTYQAMLGKIESVATVASIKTSYVTPQLSSLSDEFLQSLLKNKDFAPFSSSIKDILRDKAHTLSEENEKLLSGTGSFAGDFSAIHSNFENADLKFNKVKNAKGKALPMDNNLASIYLRDKDRILRENTYKELHGAFGRYNNFLFANYYASVKADTFYAETRHFSSCLEKALYYEEISPVLYKNLVGEVEKNLNIDHKFFDLKTEILKLPKFALCDVYYNPIKLNKTYTFEQAMDTIYDALLVLGKDYVKELKMMVETRKIDVFPTENKRSGAYEIMIIKKSPLVLTNFMGSFNDVSTLAHELGHAMHSFYSDKAQSIDNSSYTIFLAETASTVNETLLSHYMIQNAKTQEEKIYFINEYLSQFHATVFRQTMFASFEEKVHEMVEKNEDISAQILNDTYFSLVKKYFGKKVKLYDEVKYEWSRIPHFFTPFYVYKYATGIISAINIAQNLLSGKISPDDYKKFLSSGSTDTPTNLLKIVGVDYDSTQPFENAFSYVKELLEELKMALK